MNRKASGDQSKEVIPANYPDRDLFVLDWVEVPCPQCGVSLNKVNANAVDEISWTVSNHECGYNGRVEWINPNPPSEGWAGRRFRQSQLIDCHNSDMVPYKHDPGL